MELTGEINRSPAVPLGESFRQTQLVTARCDAMEKSRRYIDRHQATRVADIYTDEKKIQPIWPKVTSTPFQTRAELCKGYGRDVTDPPKRSYISRDQPSNVLNPENIRQPSNRMDDRTACVTRIPIQDQRETAKYVLPGAQAISKVLDKKKPHDRHRAYKHENRTLMDVLVDKPGAREPIKWGPIHKPVIQDD